MRTKIIQIFEFIFSAEKVECGHEFFVWILNQNTSLFIFLLFESAFDLNFDFSEWFDLKIIWYQFSVSYPNFNIIWSIWCEFASVKLRPYIRSRVARQPIGLLYIFLVVISRYMVILNWSVPQEEKTDIPLPKQMGRSALIGITYSHSRSCFKPASKV